MLSEEDELKIEKMGGYLKRARFKGKAVALIIGIPIFLILFFGTKSTFFGFGFTVPPIFEIVYYEDYEYLAYCVLLSILVAILYVYYRIKMK